MDPSSSRAPWSPNDRYKAVDDGPAGIDDINSPQWLELMMTPISDKRDSQLMYRYLDVLVRVQKVDTTNLLPAWQCCTGPAERIMPAPAPAPPPPAPAPVSVPDEGVTVSDSYFSLLQDQEAVFNCAEMERILNEEGPVAAREEITPAPEVMTEEAPQRKKPAAPRKISAEALQVPSWGKKWTVDEHSSVQKGQGRLFLVGLNVHGRGAWVEISKNFVHTRTPTQIASHAQKFFRRQLKPNKPNRRPGILDITAVPDNARLSLPPAGTTSTINFITSIPSIANLQQPPPPPPPPPAPAPAPAPAPGPATGIARARMTSIYDLVDTWQQPAVVTPNNTVPASQLHPVVNSSPNVHTISAPPQPFVPVMGSYALSSTNPTPAPFASTAADVGPAPVTLDDEDELKEEGMGDNFSAHEEE